MASITVRLGRLWRKYVQGLEFRGVDLKGNSYYEFPNPNDPSRTKRIIEYKEKKEWSDYLSDELPVQWTSWLRHNRKNPPTINEILEYQTRLKKTLENAKRLDEEWEIERTRIAQRKQLNDQNQIIEEGSSKDGESIIRPNQSIPGQDFHPTEWSQTPARRKSGNE